MRERTTRTLKRTTAAGRKRGAPPAATAHRPPAQDISAAIVDLIEREVYAPGQRLREQELADRFAVTRGRIREALHVLEARGFVGLERMKGATILRYDSAEFVAIGQVRSALMALAARRAAAEATADERSQILRAAAKLAAKGPDRSALEFRAMTIRLAALICRAAHSRYLERIVNDVHRAQTILGGLSHPRRCRPLPPRPVEQDLDGDSRGD
jgi:DNA-binding GntR family transcriptional regulator